MHTTPRSFAAYRAGSLALAVVALVAVAVPSSAHAGTTSPPLGSVVATLDPPGCCPMGLTFDGQYLWVVDRKVNQVSALDPSSGLVVKTLPTPGYRPTGIAWDGSHLFIADRDQSAIFRLDPTTGIVDEVLPIPIKSPRGLAWDGTCLYVADAKEDLIYCLDNEDGTVIRTFPAPHKAVTGLAFDGTFLWAADRNLDELHMIDPLRGQVVGIIASPGPHPWGLAWDGSHLWTVDYQDKKLYSVVTTTDDPLLHLDSKSLHVEFSIHFFAQGPDPLMTTDFYFAVPQSRYNQTLVAPPTFSFVPTTTMDDKWGQPIAHLSIVDMLAGTYIEPTMSVDVTLYRTRFWILPDQVQPYESIDKKKLAPYLGNGKKYRLDDPVVQAAAKEATKGEKSPYWKARNIYQYVLEKLDYKLSGGWDTAPILLERGTGSCSEYSFVFIALCRASGIPARYVGGIVTRGDDAFVDNVFHRWAEVYIPGYGWIPVDPDRGDKTTPRGQYLGFGNLDDTLLITTVSGGDSEYLGWSYNGNVEWTFKGHSNVYVEQIGELTPLDPLPQ